MNRKKHSAIFRKLYVITVIFISLALLSACIVFLLSDYESFIRQIVETTQKPYLENTLRNSVFTVSKYTVLRTLCFILLIIILLVDFLLIKYRNHILYFCRFVYHSLKQNLFAIRHIFLQNNRKQNISILIILMLVTARSLYYIVSFDLQYDEMWSYNYFTAQPFYYPFVAASNYPLYAISTQLFKWLPFDMKINIRLPVLIAGILSCIILYACLRKYFTTHIVALGGMTLFAFMPVATFYMLYARGVMFSLFFAIIALFSLIFWLAERRQYRHLVVYAIANAAGIYSMPTYIYFWFILFLFSLVFYIMKFRCGAKYFFLANTVAAVISLLLYAPIIAGSGLSSLLPASVDTDSKWLSIPEVWQYNLDLSYFFTGFLYGFAIILLLSFFILIVTRALKKYSFLFIFSCLLCLVPAIICILQHIEIPPRALAFTGLAIPLLFSLVLAVANTYRNNILLTISIIFAGAGTALISHRHSFLNWSVKKDRQAKDLSRSFLLHHISTCYDNSAGSGFFYYYPAIEYYYRENGKTFTLFTNADNSLRYKPFSIEDNYDCVIYSSADTAKSSHYYKWYENKKEGFSIYISNGK